MTAPPPLVLASGSATRARMLREAGLDIEIDPSSVDEDEVKSALKGEGADAAAVADTLSELKARHVARRHAGAFVIGADQVLDCGGVLFDKPTDRDHARAHLRALSGKTHELVSAVAVMRDRERLWHHIDRARLSMRPLSEAFIGDYLDRMGDDIFATVGGYRLEGLGAQLFTRVEGDFFTILGLPLLPLLDFLRQHGVVAK